MKIRSRVLSGSQKGLSLIEVMISMSILVLVVLFAFYVLTAAHHMSEESRSRLLALNAARSTLEAIKDTTLPGVPGINTAAFIPQDLPNGAINIQTNPANLAGVQIATVTVIVQWTGTKNMARQLQFTTMRSRF